LDKLEEKLLENQTKKFLIVEPGGHDGDQLIYMGLKKKLEEFGINYSLLRYRDKRTPTFFYKAYHYMKRKLLKMLPFFEKSKLFWMILDDKVYEWAMMSEKIQDPFADVILIHGGGNFNDLWGHGLHIFKNVLMNNPRSTIIVAPQSYWFQKTQFRKFFKNTKQEIHLFSRERYSYNLLRSMNLPKNLHVHLSHDSAFYLSKTDFHPTKGSYDLVCPRQDKESAVTWNIKQWGDSDIIDLRESKERIFVGDIVNLDFDFFVQLVEDSRCVFTDRLHVAIFAAILGKDTFLYPNCYYKIKGVYNFSLQKYPNVKFIDTLEKETGLQRGRSYVTNIEKNEN
jgi:exopolysaccharide biosynthesis predicted pyruvyltransferase EpsI